MAKTSAQKKTTAVQAAKSEHARKVEEVIGPGPKTGLLYMPEGFRRKNVPMHEDHIYKLKCLAFWNGVTEYEANYGIYEEFFKNHKVKDIPEKKSFLPREDKE